MPAPLDDGTMSELRARVLGSSQPGPEVLLDLAPVLPVTMLPWAIEIAGKVPEPGLRARLWAALAARLTGKVRDDLYGEALRAARTALEGDGDPEAGVVALATMAPHLHGPLLRMALDVALQAPWDFVRSGALVGLVPYLRGSLRELALDAVLTMGWELARAGALAGIAPYVKGKWRTRVEQAVAGLSQEEDRRRVMAALQVRPAAPPVDLQAALAEARATADPYWRLQALLALAPYLPEPERRQVVSEAVALAPTIPHEDWHFPAEAALAASPAVQALVESDAVRQMRALGETSRSVLCLTTLSELESRAGGGPTDTWRREVSREELHRGDGAKGLVPLSGRKTAPRYVSSGFAEPETPDAPLAKNMPLAPGQPYTFWLEVGSLQPGAIETRPVPLPVELLPQGALLQVALFGFEGEIEIDERANVGVLKLQKNGAVVERQPAGGIAGQPAPARWATRLFFPVRTPDRAGAFRLRCNIYYNQVLLQSRLVSVTVMPQPAPVEGALRAVVDYTLEGSLDLGRLAELRPHRFSLLLNDNGDKTHSFRFFGSDGEKAIARGVNIPEGTVTNLIEEARKALCRVSWGSDDEWTEDKAYRYDTPPSLDELARDLGRLAVKGYRIYTPLAQLLGLIRDDPLRQSIYKADPVQIGLKADATFVLPAALIYDYHWDTNAFPVDDPQSHYEICPSFRRAMEDSAPLEECECFRGQCPVKAEGDRIRSGQDPTKTIKDLGPVICPSGFWGFRHSLGMPVSISLPIDPDAPGVRPAFSAPIAIPYAGAPGIGLAVSTDPLLTQFKDHEKRLRELLEPAAWNPWQESRTRDDVIRMLRTIRAQLIYFYCHGGVSKNRNPFLDVGYGDAWITPDNLEANGIEWPDPGPHPLVFINGCHTVAVHPEVALNFVSAFAYRQAAGVIGAEISVFEKLAEDFAEECLRRFVQGLPIGEAVRRARLALLKKRNPLGLVYTPFVIESLRLVKAGLF